MDILQIIIKNGDKYVSALILAPRLVIKVAKSVLNNLLFHLLLSEVT